MWYKISIFQCYDMNNICNILIYGKSNSTVLNSSFSWRNSMLNKFFKHLTSNHIRPKVLPYRMYYENESKILSVDLILRDFLVTTASNIKSEYTVLFPQWIF